jgi:Kdo2-lipid IVA lauroyltransferase/acyltransferase
VSHPAAGDSSAARGQPGGAVPPRRPPNARHRAEFLLLNTAAVAGRLLGAGAAARVGSALGGLAFRPFGVRRGLVEAHLRQAFPDRSGDWVSTTARAAYRHIGREALGLLRLIRTGPREVLDATLVDGLESFAAAVAGGRGVVLVTGHLGNWEIGGAALAVRGIPLDAVAQPQENPLFDRALLAMRERLGMRVIDRRRATPLVLRSLRAGRVVAFVADQDARGHGVFVPFFGRLASTHRGPALLALRAGAPVFLGTALREPDGRYRIRLDAIPVEHAPADGEAAVRAITAAFTAGLEAAARRAPEQYFWFHKRWKTRPAEEQPAREKVY